ncbi:MAG: IS1182 family transposase, partial [Oscillospiraceae bacterium]|nr:IS1182 family transposase [Oscillospiraceae bacterium]
MKQKLKQNQCTLKEQHGQLVFAINSEIMLPENAPVRLTSAQLEELDYEKLYSAYSARDRKSKVDPRVMFKVMVYGYQCGIYSSRKLEEACRYRIDFKWLLEDEKEPDHSTFARFRTGRCGEAVEDLFYQYVKLLEKQGETDHETVFVDGTKLESCAGRYTFCWRGSVEKHLEQVGAKVFRLTGMKKRQSLKEYLSQQREQIEFVHGKGKHKSKEQRRWEELDALCKRWEEYENSLKVMGNTRNSYSKTDPDATFMRMKDDHMRNGQLKPAYNVQIAVNSEYITGIDVFSNRTDFGTLVPFLKQLQRRHETRYKEVTADAGYESLENYLYLEENEQLSFIKPANYEAQKTKKFKRQIGRIENMTYDLQEDYFTCAEGRRLLLSRETTELLNGHF